MYIRSAQYTDFPEYKTVQIRDVAEAIHTGENSIDIQVWYPGLDTSVTRKETAGIRFEVWQGNDIVCASDAECAARLLPGYVQGPVEYITPQLGMTFHYDIPKHIEWSKAKVIEKKASFVTRHIKEMNIGYSCSVKIKSQGEFLIRDGDSAGEKLQMAGLCYRRYSFPSRLLPNPAGLAIRTESGDGVFLILDLETTQSGLLALDITTPTETRIDVGFGEHLEDLRVRTSVGGRSFVVSSCCSSHRHRFIHYFRRLGCRYIQLFIYSREAVVYEAGILPVTYEVCQIPDFYSSDALHNKIYQVSKHTLHLCMHEHYEDCPWREQALYGFDSRNQMLSGYYAFGEFKYARENLRLMACSQRKDGLLELCAPARVKVNIPSFSLAFIVALEEYCRFSGDLVFGQEMLNVAERIIGNFRKQVKKYISWNYQEPEYWNFYEWNDLLDGRPIMRDKECSLSADAALQLFGILALQRLAMLRKYLGLGTEDLELEINSLIGGLENFWSEESGAYASFLREGKKVQYAELVQSLVVYTNACPESRRFKLLKGLADGKWLPITLSYSIFKYEALLQKPSEYAETVFQQIADRWGRMLFAGATSFWETDEGATAFEGAGSLCHGWSGIPIYLYGAYVMGLQPQRPGIWRPTKIASTGIHVIQGKVMTPEGQIDIGSTPGARVQNWFFLQTNGEKIYL